MNMNYNEKNINITTENLPAEATFRALVISCTQEQNSYAVVLVQTSFFPEGGGQSSDHGYIGDAKVSDVQTVDGKIVHYTDAPLVSGQEYDCRLDWDDRYRKMQHHTAEHLLCGLIHNALGYDNVGFHLSDTEVTLDVNGPLSAEQLHEFEAEANRLIQKGLPVTVSYPSPEVLPTLSYRSKLEMTENVRLVTIEGIDVCACCAPHVDNTSEIGILKVTDFMPHRGGTRITLLAGYEAYCDYAAIADNNREISAITSSKRHETAAGVAALDTRMRSLQKELTDLKKKITDLVSRSVLQELAARIPDDQSPFLLFPEGLDDVQVRNLVNACTANGADMVCAFIRTDSGFRYILSSAAENSALPEISKKMNEVLGGRGGGSSKMVQGSTPANEQEIRSFFHSL
ncbi:MAG: alanyl-tRNA editing protein [Lachnospiraceae bacterium]|nr:alanyl-tRNA editing protein [Candidatus Merdinaster equi]